MLKPFIYKGFKALIYQLTIFVLPISAVRILDFFHVSPSMKNQIIILFFLKFYQEVIYMIVVRLKHKVLFQKADNPVTWTLSKHAFIQ